MPHKLWFVRPISDPGVLAKTPSHLRAQADNELEATPGTEGDTRTMEGTAADGTRYQLMLERRTHRKGRSSYSKWMVVRGATAFDNPGEMLFGPYGEQG